MVTLGSAAAQRLRLPDFPWGLLEPYARRARACRAGFIDLSVGTPVDPTPEVVQYALAAAANAPGYPTVAGTDRVRESIVRWCARHRGAQGLTTAGVLPTIGSKELVCWLPTFLGLGPGDRVVHPQVAYPTYDVGARLAGATPVPADGTLQLGPASGVRLVWVNSPSNPTGAVLPTEHLAKVVAWARSVGAVVASDECYAQLTWNGTPAPSILDPQVCGGSHEGVLLVYSLSKQSNLAGYRAAFVAGDPEIITHLTEVRKHAGMMVPAPVQAAMVAALDDDVHVAEQRERYRRRRVVLQAALLKYGFRIDHSAAGLYLWATRDEDCWQTVAELAMRGILVAPGDFYGSAGSQHVRVALTAPDDAIEAVAARLAER